jgi:hypothetical protein
METLSIDNFSPQKTNPRKLYAWCDGCRSANVPYIKPFGGYGTHRDEVEAMRAKAKELRAFDDPAALALLKEYRGGVKMKDLAVKHGKHPETIRKTINRAKRISGLD